MVPYQKAFLRTLRDPAVVAVSLWVRRSDRVMGDGPMYRVSWMERTGLGPWRDRSRRLTAAEAAKLSALFSEHDDNYPQVVGEVLQRPPGTVVCGLTLHYEKVWRAPRKSKGA